MRCLLIAPLHFYAFASNLADGLRSFGYQVDLKNEEYPMGLWGRVVGFFFTRVIRRTTYLHFSKYFESHGYYDLIFIVKGRGVSNNLIKLFKNYSRRIVGYNYDSFRRNPSSLDWYQSLEEFATFDIQDSHNYGIRLVHLFSACNINPVMDRKYDISIVQRIHSDRLKFAYLICKAFPDKQKFIFLYEPSFLTFIYGFVRNPIVYFIMLPHISFRPLPYLDAMRAIANSRVTFDFALPEQSGITIRCFEAQSLGVSVMTNNEFAVDAGIFDPASIAYLPLGADKFFVRSVLMNLLSSRGRPFNRSMNDFLKDILMIRYGV